MVQMITIPVENLISFNVGSVEEYREKLRLSELAASEKQSLSGQTSDTCFPEFCALTTLQELFGLPPMIPMREALGV